MTELKAQVNRLEAEMEEQRTHKQMAMVENEHLRMEVEALRTANVANVGAQIGFKEADSEQTFFCTVKWATQLKLSPTETTCPLYVIVSTQLERRRQSSALLSSKRDTQS